MMRIYNKSVFKRMPKGSAMADVLATLYHRSSATLYAIYTVWAIISLATGIPSLQAVGGDLWQIFFSAAVLLLAAPACFGATYWPLFARLELFAGAGFIGLLMAYVVLSAINVLNGNGSWAGWLLVVSLLVIPISRVAIVAVFLLRQADERRNTEG